MKLTFANINWRSTNDSDVFNMHGIRFIELDTDTNMVTIKCATNTYSSPFYGLTYGGGVTHFEFTAMHPYNYGKYIDIVIFESTSKVCISNHNGNVPEYFKNKCRNFCHI